jgi:hypothetical protein
MPLSQVRVPDGRAATPECGYATAANNGLANNWTAFDYGIAISSGGLGPAGIVVGGTGTMGGSAVSPDPNTVPTVDPYDVSPDSWKVDGAVAFAFAAPVGIGCVNARKELQLLVDWR